MKASAHVLTFALCISFSIAMADDAKKPDGPAEVTKIGKLSKPFNVPKEVVAILRTAASASGNGKAKKQKQETISLVASGDLADQLGELIKKDAAVTVTGKFDEATMTLTVTKVSETTIDTPAKSKDPKKKKAK